MQARTGAFLGDGRISVERSASGTDDRGEFSAEGHSHGRADVLRCQWVSRTWVCVIFPQIGSGDGVDPGTAARDGLARVATGA